VISNFGSFEFGSGHILSRLTSCALDFGSFEFGSGQISGSLILGHLRFRVVRVRIRSGRVSNTLSRIISCFV
jgi:hypothetical protein